MSTASFARNREITRPSTTPLTSTLFDHATVETLSSFGLRNNEGLWPSYNCLDLMIPTPSCPDPVGTKSFTKATWQDGFEFAVYGGVQCSAVGLDKADQQSEVKRVFGLSESKGVERMLVEEFTATPPQDLTPVVGAPGNPSVFPLALALALLEGHAAANYAGVPTIHMPRAAASLLNERIVWEGGKAYTRAGSKVAIGGGYDDQAMLASGEWTLYATGEVYIERSEQIDIQSYVIPGDGSGTGSDENGLSDNTVVAFAERMYRVGIDCYTAKATGTMWS